MQIVDLKELSLAEFSLKMALSRGGASRVRTRRDVTDGLRTVFWYRGVEERTGLRSAYALEMHFEPESFSAGSPRKKWGKYRCGIHVPTEGLVNRVEAECPGLRRELNHLVWQIVKQCETSLHQIELWLGQLGPSVQEVLQRRDKLRQAGESTHAVIDRRLVASLERRAGLDALAAIILLLRRAHLTGKTNEAHEWGRNLYRMLTILGITLRRRGIAQPFFELIERNVMADLNHQGIRYWLPTQQYRQTVLSLCNALYHIKDVPYRSMSAEQKNVYMSKILNGCYGWDYKFAFNPIKQWASPATSPLPDILKDLQISIWLYQWAWNMLSIGSHRQFPPAEVFLGTNLWAREQEDWPSLHRPDPPTATI